MITGRVDTWGVSREVVDGLSRLIESNMGALYAECCNPGADADMMDNTIKTCKERISILRGMRTTFEDHILGGGMFP